jgi:hypothetical protein
VLVACDAIRGALDALQHRADTDPGVLHLVIPSSSPVSLATVADIAADNHRLGKTLGAHGIGPSDLCRDGAIDLRMVAFDYAAHVKSLFLSLRQGERPIQAGRGMMLGGRGQRSRQKSAKDEQAKELAANPALLARANRFAGQAGARGPTPRGRPRSATPARDKTPKESTKQVPPWRQGARPASSSTTPSVSHYDDKGTKWWVCANEISGKPCCNVTSTAVWKCSACGGERATATWQCLKCAIVIPAVFNECGCCRQSRKKAEAWTMPPQGVRFGEADTPPKHRAPSRGAAQEVRPPAPPGLATPPQQ